MKIAIRSDAARWDSESSACRACLPVAVAVALSGTLSIDVARAADDAGVTEVVVTASRVARDGFTAPTPTTVLGAAEIEAQGARNISSVLFELPAMRPTQTNPLSSQNSGSTYANLRGLGSDRTLVLVDGRRFVPNSAGGGVDTNVIPAALVQRIEVVTGGASAAWGSDAVAGVVNLLLDDDLTGFRADTQYGLSEHNDEEEISASLAFGTGFANDRGHFVIATDVLDNSGILDQSRRDWSAKNWTLFSNPDFAPGNGQVARIITPDATLSRATYGGVIIGPGPLRGIQFGPGGTPMQFNTGSIVGTLYQLGGDGAHLGDGANLSAPRKRQSVFSKMKFDLTDNVNLFAEVAYAKSETTLDIVETTDNGSSSITIQRDNAFLPEAVRTMMADNDIDSFTMGRVHAELGREINTVSNEVKRAAIGLEGSFGAGWNWDIYYQYGRNRYDAQLAAHRIEALWRQAVDAVIDPASGKAVCRSTLANDGCLPINVFGPNSIDPAAGARVIGTQKYLVDSTQSVAAASLQGEPFSIWAGPVSVAAGVEYRKETMDGDSDPISQANGWRYGNPKPVRGEFDVQEIFAETVVPLASGLPFADSIEFNGAVRYTDYSTIGDVVTWKAGLNYSPTDQLRFRATRSRDIRAPNIGELFSTGNTILVSVTDPATLQDSRILGVTGGNPNLSEEVADTLTAGVVYEPSWLNGLHLAADYYEIELDDAIAAIAAQAVVDRCYRGQTNFCSAITRDPGTGLLVRVAGGQFNLEKLRTRGVDFEAGYSFPLSRIADSAPGTLGLRLLATRVFELSSTDGTTLIETAGQVVRDGVPHWNVNFSSTYANGPATWTLRARYVGGGKFNNAWGPYDISDNTVSGRFYLNTSLGYTLAETDTMDVQLFGKIDNLLDKDPPITPDAGVQPLASSSVHYDRIGRTYALGVRLRF